jgi:hypothetical protein
MQIRIRETGAVVYENEFRAMFPNTGFPVPLTEAIINDFGGDVVFEGPQATGGTVYQYSQRQGVEQINGKWYTKYVLGPVFTDNEEATAAEQEANYKAMKDAEQAKNVRDERNRRIAALDWTQGKDIPENISNPASVIRQALRDVPEQVGFPWEIVWPDVE